MKVTRDFIFKYGQNREQLTILGVEYPPKRGWLWAIEGKEISEEQARRYIAARKIRTGDLFEKVSRGAA
jgi:hypothetical protein